MGHRVEGGGQMKKVGMALAALWFAWGLLRQPETASAAAGEGLLLCAQTVIPSLFPFFVVVSLLIQMGAVARLQRLFAPFMGPLFELRGVCAAPLIAGLVGGYPSGARAAAELFEQGALTREEAERCLAFVNNCGPAFILSYVGAGVLHSSQAGVYLYLIHALAAFLTGMLLRGRGGERGRLPLPPSGGERPKSLAQMFTGAVTGSFSAVLQICAFVVLFRTAAALLPGQLPAAALGAVEMVSGIAVLPAGPEGFITAAGILGWGGLSVHCQTMAVLGTLRARRHWLGKGLQCLISVALAALAVKAGLVV